MVNPHLRVDLTSYPFKSPKSRASRGFSINCRCGAGLVELLSLSERIAFASLSVVHYLVNSWSLVTSCSKKFVFEKPTFDTTCTLNRIRLSPGFHALGGVNEFVSWFTEVSAKMGRMSFKQKRQLVRIQGSVCEAYGVFFVKIRQSSMGACYLYVTCVPCGWLFGVKVNWCAGEWCVRCMPSFWPYAGDNLRKNASRCAWRC